MTADDRLLHICHAPADRAWVLGCLVPALGLRGDQYATREHDTPGDLRVLAVADGVERHRYTVLVGSSAVLADRFAQLAAALAQHLGLERGAPRLIVLVRDPVLGSGGAGLPLAQRALVQLDCTTRAATEASFARLRELLALPAPADERPACPYLGLASFTAADRELLFGRDADRDELVRRIRKGQRRLLLVGPAGSGKSSLVHAAVLTQLAAADHLVQVVPRGDSLARALRATVDALEVPGLGAALDAYAAEIRGASADRVRQARDRLARVRFPDARRRVVVIDPLEEVFAEDDAAGCDLLFDLLSGLWSLEPCTVILCMRTDFDTALMGVRWWREAEDGRYPVAALDEAELRAAIVGPARLAGVQVDDALVERLIGQVDADRSSMPLPLLQVALKEVWAHLRWRHLTLADYEGIVDRDQRGLAAVLTVHADAVLQRLTAPGDAVIAQRILLDLVHLGEGRPHTRRRRAIDELRRSGDAPGQVERVLGALLQGRLVTAGDGAADRERARPRGPAAGDASQLGRHVDLAHDTLITGWPALAGWITARRDDLRTQRRLEARAATGALLRSAELPEFEGWLASTADPAGQLLGASAALRDLVRRSVSARRKLLAVPWIVTAAVLGAAAVFWLQVQQLRDESARTRQSTSGAMELVSMNVFDLERELRKVPGGSAARERLLARLRELVARLRAQGELPEVEQRIAMVVKLADADLAVERGRLDNALVLYREGLAESERRAAADPHTWGRDLAVTYNKLGDLTMQLGRLGEAHRWYDLGFAICQMFRNPDNPAWQRDLSVAYEKQGDVAVGVGALDEARRWYAEALDVIRRVAAGASDNADWQRDLLVAYDKVGNLAQRTGRIEEARAAFGQTIAVAQTLATGEAGNAQRQLDLAMACERQADLGDDLGELGPARDWAEQAIAVLTRLVTADQGNTTWRHELAMACKRRGEIAMHAGELAEARGWFDRVIAILRELAAADPRNAGLHDSLAAALERRGEVEVRARSAAAGTCQSDEAHVYYAQALAIRRAQVAADPRNSEGRRDLCAVLVMIAQVTQDPDEQAAGLFEARAIYTHLQRDGAFRGDKEFARIGAGLERLTATCFVAAL